MSSITNANCILIIGATSGIGLSLALAIHSLPSKPTVIVAGRRQERLDAISKERPDIETVQFDVTSSRDILQTFVHDITLKYPKLDAIMFAAGVQHLFDFTKPDDINVETLESEINTNYTAVVVLTRLFLPHLLKLGEQGRPAFIIPISSGLAIRPRPTVPNYSATKAALHSFCLSLTAQLKSTNVHVIEILPPLTESELHDHQGTVPSLSRYWMPLDEFTRAAMEGLVRGDIQIPVGLSVVQWNQFEKVKFNEVLHGRD